jgi:hypothetical protein
MSMLRRIGRLLSLPQPQRRGGHEAASARRRSSNCEPVPAGTATAVARFGGMDGRITIAVVLGLCAGLLIIGLVFSSRLTAGISQAAQMEATQHAPVPTPSSLAAAKPAPAKPAAARPPAAAHS